MERVNELGSFNYEFLVEISNEPLNPITHPYQFKVSANNQQQALDLVADYCSKNELCMNCFCDTYDLRDNDVDNETIYSEFFECGSGDMYIGMDNFKIVCVA